jgi:ABC-type Zn uptake system ZnuABC Zn-binding protein ZnuA
MLDKFFEELIIKGIVKKTKYIFMVDNAGNNIYKAINKETRDIIINRLTDQGMQIEKNKENKVYCIYYQGYFAGCLSY